MGGNAREGASFLSTVPSDRTRNNRHKTKHRKFHLKTNKQTKPPRVVKHWHRLPREVVESPSLEDTQKLTGHNPGQPAVVDTA